MREILGELGIESVVVVPTASHVIPTLNATVEFLNREYKTRRDKNPRYSLRSFAKCLGIDAGHLSRLLKGERRVGTKLGVKIAKALSLTDVEREAFLRSIDPDYIESLSSYKTQQPQPSISEELTEEIKGEVFEMISNQVHYAILELTNLEGFESDVKWISFALGNELEEVQQAVARLFRLGLLVDKDGKWEKSGHRYTTANPMLTTPALKSHQKQVLQNAVRSLLYDPLPHRVMYSMTMSINADQLPRARNLIERFAHHFCDDMTTEKHNRVYQLGVSFYPLSRKV